MNKKRTHDKHKRKVTSSMKTIIGKDSFARLPVSTDPRRVMEKLTLRTVGLRTSMIGFANLLVAYARPSRNHPMMNLTVIEGEASSALFSRAVQLVSVTMLFLLQLTSACAQVPRIGDFNPISAHVGDTVTISGANFGATPADNIVYFGAVRATVKS